MVPFELLLLSALAASSTAHSSPVPIPQFQSTHKFDWAQVSFSDGRKLPILHNGYQCYLSKYPDRHEWLSWSRLWDINREQVLSSNGGDTYIQHYIEEGILRAADKSDVDARLVLAILMQETKGGLSGECKAKAKCGLLLWEQSFDKERPRDSILEMLLDGLEGSSGRPGLATRLKSEDSPYAAVWRYYEDVELLISETQYANDLANRLIGWSGRGKGFEGCGQ